MYDVVAPWYGNRFTVIFRMAVPSVDLTTTPDTLHKASGFALPMVPGGANCCAAAREVERAKAKIASVERMDLSPLLTPMPVRQPGLTRDILQELDTASRLIVQKSPM